MGERYPRERNRSRRFWEISFLSSNRNHGYDAPSSSSTSTPRRSSPWQLHQRCRPSVHFLPTCPGSRRTTAGASFALLLHSYFRLLSADYYECLARGKVQDKIRDLARCLSIDPGPIRLLLCYCREHGLSFIGTFLFDLEQDMIIAFIFNFVTRYHVLIIR